MTNTEFFNQHVSPAMADIILEMDGDKVDMYAMLYANLLDESVWHITQDEAMQVINLQPGQSVYIGITEIKKAA